MKGYNKPFLRLVILTYSLEIINILNGNIFVIGPLSMLSLIGYWYLARFLRITWPLSLMDKATAFEAVESQFESGRGHYIFKRTIVCNKNY